MKRAQIQLAAESIERDAFVEMPLQVTADLFDQLRLSIAGVLAFGLTAQAGAKAGALGGIAALEEDHVLTPGPAGGARRPAIYAGGDHGEKENAVHVGVAGF
jgi:hypothetical protein